MNREESFVVYEYKNVTAQSERLSMLVDGYEHFGWQLDERKAQFTAKGYRAAAGSASGEPDETAYLKRNRNIVNPVAKFIMQYANGEMKSGIEGTFNSVDVRDLADGVIACCDKGRRGECYIMSNDMVSMQDMFTMINEAGGYSYKPSVLSVRTAKLVAKVMGMISKVTGKPSPLTDFAIYNLCRNNDFDCSKARRELGYHCRSFAETIQDEVRWLAEEGKIQCPAMA